MMDAPAVTHRRPDPLGETAIRPSSALYWRAVRASLQIAALWWASAVALLTRAFLGGARAVVLVGVPIVFASIATYLVLVPRKTSYFVGDGYFGWSNFLGRRRTWPTDELVAVQGRRVDLGRGPRIRYLFIGRHRKLLFTIPVQVFDPDDLRLLMSRLGVVARTEPSINSIRQLNRQFPGAIPALLAH